MTTCETHQEECPVCQSSKMFVTEGYDSDRGDFVDYFCPVCQYEDSEEGEVND